MSASRFARENPATHLTRFGRALSLVLLAAALSTPARGAAYHAAAPPASLAERAVAHRSPALALHGRDLRNTRATVPAELATLRAAGYPQALAPGALHPGAPGDAGAGAPGRSPYGVAALPCGSIGNCSFESGAFGAWSSTDLVTPYYPAQVLPAGSSLPLLISSATDGIYSYANGFDGGGPGTIALAQDVILPPDAVLLEFDYRVAWSMGGMLDRTFSLDIEPSGGGTPLSSNLLFTAAAGTSNPDTGPLHAAVAVAALSGQSVRIVFRWSIPESFTGPGSFVLDKVTVTESICGPVANCSFETGSASSWTVADFTGALAPAAVVGPGVDRGFGTFLSAPTDGGFALTHYFDSFSPGDMTVDQDVTLPAGALSVEFDWRAGWDMLNFGGSTLPRTFRFEVQPAGGGAPLSTQAVLSAAAGSQVLDTGARRGFVDLSAFAGQTVRLAFVWNVPEATTGPAFFQLDRVRLSASVCGDVSNCSFETGSLPGWSATDFASPFNTQHVGSVESIGFGLFTTAPSNGGQAFIMGFDGGGPGTADLYQDVTLPVWAERLRFDYRAGWDMLTVVNTSTLPRVFRVAVEPTGGGIPLQSETVLVAAPLTQVLDTGPVTRSIDIAAFAGQDVRLVFRWDVPENFTGPGQFQLDHVALNSSLLSAPGSGAPRSLSLMPATPNPAREATTFRFSLPAAGDVELEVVDVRGARVWHERRAALPAGAHAIRWEGRAADGREAPAGVYFARVRTPDAGSSRMFVRVK